MFDVTVFAQKAQQLVEAGQFLYSQGWSPATSSNYSARLDDQHIAITVSGKHKGKLTPDDIMVVDVDGLAMSCETPPSAETLLHTVIYKARPDIGAVLHTHSMPATVLGRIDENSDELQLSDYELLKAFEGVDSHAKTLKLPVFENTQDISALSERTKPFIEDKPAIPGYMIRGHGLYTWGSTMNDCLRHIEALEFLLQCELEIRKANT